MYGYFLVGAPRLFHTIPLLLLCDLYFLQKEVAFFSFLTIIIGWLSSYFQRNDKFAVAIFYDNQTVECAYKFFAI